MRLTALPSLTPLFFKLPSYWCLAARWGLPLAAPQLSPHKSRRKNTFQAFMRKQSPLFLSEEVLKCLCWMHFPLTCQQVLKSSVGIIDPVPSGGHYIPGAHLLQWQTLYNAYAHKHTCIQAQKHPLALKTQTYAHRLAHAGIFQHSFQLLGNMQCHCRMDVLAVFPWQCNHLQQCWKKSTLE